MQLPNWFYLLGTIYFILAFIVMIMMIPLRIKKNTDKRKRRVDNLEENIEELREELFNLHSKLNPDPEDNNWNDNKVIDFVNWYLKVKQLDSRYDLENRNILDSFKNGDSVEEWKKYYDNNKVAAVNKQPGT